MTERLRINVNVSDELREQSLALVRLIDSIDAALAHGNVDGAREALHLMRSVFAETASSRSFVLAGDGTLTEVPLVDLPGGGA